MSNRNNLAAAVAVLALSLTGAASAQTAPAAASGKPAAKAENSPEQVFNRWDKDKNKSLSLEEFRAGFGEVAAANAVRKLRQNFNTMDVNKSGGIEQAEYANLELIKKAGARAPAMSSFDIDKNSKLDFKEYVTMVEAMVRSK